MYQRGMDVEEIGALTGAHPATVQYRLNKKGIRLRGSRGPLPNPHERFARKWTPEPNTGCWLWAGGTDSFGYGFFRHAGEVTAHRVSYTLHIAPIPKGLHVLHKCDVPECVNPAHLFLGTQIDNMKDCARKGRTQRANAAKTHCPQGHPYSGENLKVRPDGRECRACARIKSNRYRRKNVEAVRARDRRIYWAKKEQQNAERSSR